jgi:hypothetical protein
MACSGVDAFSVVRKQEDLDRYGRPGGIPGPSNQLDLQQGAAADSRLPMQAIRTVIANYGMPLEPVRDAALRYTDDSSVITAEGVLLIGRRPWVGPENYTFTLFPPLDRRELQRFSQTWGVCLPAIYAEVLCQLNGAVCFGSFLCGIPKSALTGDLRLERTTLQCPHLALALQDWARGYRVAPNWFHFGYRYWSRVENAGFFIDERNQIISARKSGVVVGAWTSFRDFLSDELAASEALEDELHARKS